MHWARAQHALLLHSSTQQLGCMVRRTAGPLLWLVFPGSLQLTRTCGRRAPATSMMLAASTWFATRCMERCETACPRTLQVVTEGALGSTRRLTRSSQRPGSSCRLPKMCLCWPARRSSLANQTNNLGLERSSRCLAQGLSCSKTLVLSATTQRSVAKQHSNEHFTINT